MGTLGAIVLDASAVVEFLIAPAGSPVDDYFGVGADLHVPEVCDVEVVASIRRRVANGSLSDSQALDALIDYLDMPITRHRHLRSIGRMYALWDNFTPFDSAYVALAEILGVDLLTVDRRLAKAVERHTAVRCLP